MTLARNSCCKSPAVSLQGAAAHWVPVVEVQAAILLGLTVLSHLLPVAAWHVSMAPSPATGANIATCAPTMQLTVPFWKAVSTFLR